MLLHLPPDPAGLHSSTSIKLDVCSAGTLQGSKSLYLHFNFLVVCLLKHFLEPPQLIPDTAAYLVSNLTKFLHVSSAHLLRLLWNPWYWHTWLWRDLQLHNSRQWLGTCPCSCILSRLAAWFQFPCTRLVDTTPAPQILWWNNLPAQVRLKESLNIFYDPPHPSLTSQAKGSSVSLARDIFLFLFLIRNPDFPIITWSP